MSKNHPDYERGYCDAALNYKAAEPSNKMYMDGYNKAIETGRKWDG